MKVARIVSFEGTMENMIGQCKSSAPSGSYKLPNGLKLTITTLLCPKVLEPLLDYAPDNWPLQYRIEEEKDDKESSDKNRAQSSTPTPTSIPRKESPDGK